MQADQFADCRKTVGLRETLKALEKDQLERVYVARDAERRVVQDVLNLCQQKGLPVEEVDSMMELGKACSIQVGTATAGIYRK